MTVYEPKKDEAEPQVTMSLPPQLIRKAVKGSNASQAEIAQRVRQQRETGGAESVKPNPHANTLLKMGSRGEPVTYLQTTLNTKGASIGVDGAFGPQTYRAVVSFQRSAGLVADGIVGGQTWGAIGKGGAKVEDKADDKAGGGKTKGADTATKEPPLPKKKPGDKSDKEIDAEIEVEDETGGQSDEAKTDGEKFREEYVKQLLYFEGSQEHGHQSERFQEILPSSGLAGARKDAASRGRTFTTCNTFSGILQSRVEQKTGVKLLKKVNLHIMDPKWREKNLPPGAFVKCEPGVSERPRAGDIIIQAAMNGVTFKHMGNLVADPVVNSDGTEQWDCVDGGQGQAHDASGKNANEAIMRIGNTYNPETSVIKKPGPWAQDRLVYGWVDLAKLAGG